MDIREKLPINIRLLDLESTIREEKWKEVTSPLVREPSTNKFHPNGLYSEEIFGQVGTTERLVTFGYISLRCQVIHPWMFFDLCQLKSLYSEVLSGKTYAIWNSEDNDFDRAEATTPGANTGYAFFIGHLNDLVFKATASKRRDDKIQVLKKYENIMLINTMDVIPAGIRDITTQADGRDAKDEINDLYLSLMSSCAAMPLTGGNRAIYDSIRYSIQRKVNEIVIHIINLLGGKGGYLESSYAARAIAFGARNVITASTMTAPNPRHPQYHKSDESKVPLYQAAKSMLPLVVYNMKHCFFQQIASSAADQIAVIDPKTLQLSYRPIDEREKDSLLTSEGIGKRIDLFQDASQRYTPVTIQSTDGKRYYPFLIYDDETRVWIVRDILDAKDRIPNFTNEKLRPMTNCEMLYIATWLATKNKVVNTTRYPVTDEQSIYPSKIHLMSTSPARVVDLDGAGAVVTLPEYPIIGQMVIDALMLHPGRLKPLGGDFDGDKVNSVPLLARETIQENLEYLKSVSNWIDPSGRIVIGFDDLTQLSLYSLSEPPKE